MRLNARAGKIAIGKTPAPQQISRMSTVGEIETALQKLPLEQTQEIAQWLEKYLHRQNQRAAARPAASNPPPVKLPDYATRRRLIFGEKVLPNMILAAREEERW